MTDGSNQTEFENERLKSFAEKVSRADGSLISLPGVKSRLGEPLYISARFGSDEIQPELRYLNVDVIAVRQSQYIPVGIYDWEIKGEEAFGNKQRHGHLPAKNQAHQEADKYWSTGEAFHVRDDDLLKHSTENGGMSGMSGLRSQGVITNEDQWTDPVYQGRGIGSLLITVSALVLKHHGITEMNLGTLSSDAQRVWKKFDRNDRANLSPSEVVDHPASVSTLIKFLIG